MTTQNYSRVNNIREILFRGKRIDNGEWVYGNLEQDIETGTVRIKGYDYFISVDSDGTKYCKMFCHEVKPETVGQYTGEIDTNGSKIFEDDVVKRKAFYPPCCDDCVKGFTGVVGFIASAFKVQGINQFDNVEDNLRWGYTIIGNTHDNPELLGGNNHE